MSTKDEDAKILAALHYQIEPGITQIFRINADATSEQIPDEPIKLLEVNRDTVPSGILPLQFGPAPASGIHFPSVIIEVTPEEYDRIATAELPLPSGWRIGDLLPRPTGNDAA